MGGITDDREYEARYVAYLAEKVVISLDIFKAC